MAVERLRKPLVVGNARFTGLGAGCLRLEWAEAGRFAPGPSVLVGRRQAKPAPVEVRRSKRGCRIVTESMTLEYVDDGRPFHPGNLSIDHVDYLGRPRRWVPGRRDAGNLGSVCRSMDQWKWCGGPERHPVEGVLSTDGGHLIEDRARAYWHPEHDWPQSLQKQVAFDGYFFAYGNDYRRALRDFVTVFGSIPMLPRWALGLWYSRWYAYSDRELVELVERYRKERFPLDVLVIDTDWRAGWGGYDWDSRTFPKPERALEQLHALGVRVGLNDHPGYDDYESLPDDDSHVPIVERELGPLPHDGRWACDWSNARAVRTWRRRILGPRFDEGMDFWWIDGWIRPPFPGVDSQLWANHHYHELAREKRKARGLVLSRWGGVGSHRYPVQFSGDTRSDWQTLREQVEVTSASGGLGAVYWSHDIGGFFGNKIDEELFVRWMQFGAVSPMLRTHSDHGVREPWRYSARAKRLVRQAVHIRYALAPYLYTLVWEAHTEGLPLVRPLYLYYTDNDGGALQRRGQYLLGRDVLVVPADGPVDAATGTFAKRAYFPDATWLDLVTGERLHGMDDRHIAIPLERLPLFVRTGTILPCQRVGEALGAAPPEDIEFDVYPHPLAESTFALYEDDGDSLDHERGRCAITRVRAGRDASTLRFVMEAPEGSYRGMPRRRGVTVRMQLDEGDAVRGLRVWRGSRKTTDVAWRETQVSLAGALATALRFAEVRVDGVGGALTVEIDV